MAEHTPAPWSVSVDTNTEVIGPHQRTICRAHRDAPTRSEEETRANARLISAAPELLEACESALRFLEIHRERGKAPTQCEADLRAAIAKARGDT
jgi:hypothetical protein